mmetsp:Transcript_9049/g.27052  ORF Transcript_9049/g.27052 Transcript_9049/m.27052 type:complete len:272 (-) Transcript_9049:309-1124(-)|eukprot:CAMPEP_0113527582 /NCGR_PEP_ID=MMETSP0015_2-20120614/1373_1 /TAXON_ID=2838 /ORGANISM="Odontella" /LENGTH=271 /DNA_ID=CAMNT_0000426027 /DNA_START=195 /DNA_END=1010 /DNA_ORIENTATION=+ /assembly_acc=CAM_ASM_000160
MGFTSTISGGGRLAIFETKNARLTRCKYAFPRDIGLRETSIIGQEQLTVDPNAFSLVSTPTDATFTSQVPSQTFEPVVNAPAVGAFLFISVVFSLLQIRISGINRAATRRAEALRTLREVKSVQLSAADLGEEDSRPSTDDVARALNEYEEALREELKLRTVIPGVRIVAPNDPKEQEKDLAAARQFLDMDINESGELLMVEDSEVKQRKQTPTKTSEDAGMSNGAKVVLAAVALTQVLLLVLLSFDPMTADSVFTTIGGQPPANVPLSSW